MKFSVKCYSSNADVFITSETGEWSGCVNISFDGFDEFNVEDNIMYVESKILESECVSCILFGEDVDKDSLIGVMNTIKNRISRISI